MVRAITYARVSTKEQVQGYSLNQQSEALGEYSQVEGIEVLEGIRDEGYSGAYLERPGLDQLRNLVEDGGVDLVLVQDRDRLSREPAHFFLLKEEFKRHGCKIVALTAYADDETPWGEFINANFDNVAKLERMLTAERTRRGRQKKAREGKVVGTGTPNYGYRFVKDRYEIEPDEAEIVSRIFHMVASGSSIYEVYKMLMEENVRTRRGAVWHRNSIRPLIMNDVYKGTYWYNRYRKKYHKVRAEDRYKTKVESVENPKESWIAIPVPQFVPDEIVDKARANISDNTFKVSSNSDRLWELSGGVAVCAECDRAMTTVATTVRGKMYLYYRCSNNSYYCSNSKNYRALELEEHGIRVLQDLYSDNSKIKAKVMEMFDA
jgi:site-specific DNA recombinase